MPNLTQFLVWQSDADKMAVFLAEDSTDVCKDFQNEFVGAQNKSETDFVNIFRNTGNFALLLIDGELLIGRTRVKADDWLANNDMPFDFKMGKCVVVYSYGPGHSKFAFRWYEKSRTGYRQDFSEIRELAMRTIQSRNAPGMFSLAHWPQALAGTTEKLSQIIHALHNTFLPIVLDVETLAEIRDKFKAGGPEADAVDDERKSVVVEIFKDHFGSDGIGYLGEKSTQHNTANIIRHVQTLCDELTVEIQEKIKPSCHVFEQGIMDANAWGNSQQQSEISHDFAIQLHGKLKSVSKTGNDIVAKLREIRRTQTEEKK